MRECNPGYGIGDYDLARIPIVRACRGYYLRWYYNGWHYWFFLPGSQILLTEGEKYRTIGTRKVQMSTGQITLIQAQAIRTIMNTREVYIYTDNGWADVGVEPGSIQIHTNMVDGVEIEITVVVGSKGVSNKTGFSPVINIPEVEAEADPDICELPVIGAQIWMCKNYDSNYPGSKVFDNVESNRAIYGGLYTWDQVMAAGFCPAGWHVPTLAEWEDLITEAGGALLAGGELKEAGTTHWNAPNTGAVDTYGFAALPGGDYDGAFGGRGNYGFFWTATPGGALTANFVQLSYNNAQAVNSVTYRNSYLSVRLIKDGDHFPVPLATAADVDSSNIFTANWDAVAGATGYYLDVSTDPAFGSFVAGFNNLNVGNVTTYDVTGLSPDTDYYYRVRATNGVLTSESSNVITTATFPTITVTARGAGTGVAILNIQTDENVVLTLDGNARFYSDAAGTLDESTTWTCTSGALRTRYVKCTAGTSNMMFSKHSAIIQAGDVTAGGSGTEFWEYTDILAVNDTPRLTCNNLINDYFPNITDIFLRTSAVCAYTYSIANLPNALIKISDNSSGTASGSLGDLNAATEILYLVKSSSISGNVNQIPATVTDFQIHGSNTITGDIANIPAATTIFTVIGNNTITGDVADLSANIITFYVVGSATTIYGALADVPAQITQFYARSGGAGITGDFTDLSANLIKIYLNNVGAAVTGDLADLPANMTECFLLGSAVITGDFADLSASMRELRLQTTGESITGDPADLPANIRQVWATGSNTIAGVLADFPASLTDIHITGSNTLSGDIGDLADSTIRNLVIEGLNTIADYSGRTWNSTQNNLSIVPTGAGGLSSAEIDQLLIDIDADCSFTGIYKAITLTGTNAAPTAASAAARASLIAKGVTLTTN